MSFSVRETELRQLRKQTTELEEQNAILGKHIENMKQAIEKLQVEAVQQRNNNMALQGHLDALRQTLTSNFSAVPLPGMISSRKSDFGICLYVSVGIKLFYRCKVHVLCYLSITSDFSADILIVGILTFISDKL